MKVEEIKKVSAKTHDWTEIEHKKSSAGQNQAFYRQMTKLNEEQHLKYIKGLQAKIIEQGETIKEKADIEEIAKYRQLISELLNDLVSNSYTCSKSDSFDARGKHKIFVVIKTVNKKLDELANEILTEQKDKIKLLEMVDDIRGLLVDLFL